MEASSSPRCKRLLKGFFVLKAVTLAVVILLNWKDSEDLASRGFDLFLQTGQSIMTSQSSSYEVSNTTITTAGTKKNDDGNLRILYTITSLSEYNSGKRATAKGSDRLRETLIPVLREGVLSMLEFGYHVDVFLICHWEVQPERLQLIRDALPSQVGLDYWDDATPLGYKLEQDETYLRHNTRALARQHRFVIKDKLLDYDFFVNFEDDMLVTGHHVEHNLKISKELTRLRDLAPEEPTEYDLNKTSRYDLQKKFHGQLTKTQLSRMIPGFIRIEALLDEAKYPAQNKTGPIPVDLEFENGASEVNPEYCCHVRNETSSDNIPMRPLPSKLFLWETGIIALGIRKMPNVSNLDWVMLQRGPNPGGMEVNELIGEYWSGSNKEFKQDKRPNPTEGKYVNNQGGWMASRQQIWEWHTSICPGGFLPPYYPPHYNLDGLDLRNVEYWSGGLHLFTRQHACNMQRIITLDPEGFSKHLVYHTANNKQRQLAPRREKTFSKANTLLGQLNYVRKRAEKALQSGKRR